MCGIIGLTGYQSVINDLLFGVNNIYNIEDKTLAALSRSKIYFM